MQSISALAPAAARPQSGGDSGNHDAIKNLFLVLQGSYGTSFLSKFSTGVVDKENRDLGVRAAMAVWRAKLAKYPGDVIEAAADRVTEAHSTFPPNLPEFEAICRAVMPRKTHAELSGLALLPPPPLSRVDVNLTPVGDGRDWARKIMARIAAGDQTVTRHSRMAAMETLGINLQEAQ